MVATIRGIKVAVLKVALKLSELSTHSLPIEANQRDEKSSSSFLSAATVSPADECTVCSEEKPATATHNVGAATAVAQTTEEEEEEEEEEDEDDEDVVVDAATAAPAAEAALQRKLRIASIFQHYYPEGGWGFVVLACGALAQILAHGTQLSFGVVGAAAAQRFRQQEPAEKDAEIGRRAASSGAKNNVFMKIVKFGKSFKRTNYPPTSRLSAPEAPPLPSSEMFVLSLLPSNDIFLLQNLFVHFSLLLMSIYDTAQADL